MYAAQANSYIEVRHHARWPDEGEYGSRDSGSGPSGHGCAGRPRTTPSSPRLEAASLRDGGFKGPVHAANPHLEFDWQAAFARAADLPSVPEVAVICTPPATVAGLIDNLDALGTRAAVLLTSGLHAEQKKPMLVAARPHMLRILLSFIQSPPGTVDGMRKVALVVPQPASAEEAGS